MLSTDLAELYEVEARSLVQAVKRNLDRFPADFMFQLTWEEQQQALRSQSVILDGLPPVGTGWHRHDPAWCAGGAGAGGPAGAVPRHPRRCRPAPDRARGGRTAGGVHCDGLRAVQARGDPPRSDLERHPDRTARTEGVHRQVES